MFDSLLNSKFYNKCKHAFKCIRMRLVPIRRKKQAMIRFMKKDIADLLTNGLDTHAFGRMDGLIIEMNHASCYDMIEQFCEYIGKQLNSLQKQRDCPQETREAVSTIIFAAARFPDLPELCDLRHIFTERYGNFLEPFVSLEFVQKLENKVFTNEEKLQAMQSVSEEFSVNFDTKALKIKLWATPETKHDLLEKDSKKQVELAMPLSSKQKGDNDAPSGRKSEAANPLGHKKKLEVSLKQQRDVHPVADGIDRLHENTRRQHADKSVGKGHLDKPVSDSEMKRRNVQKEVQKANKKDSRPCEKELMEAVELDLNGLPKKGLGSLKVPETESKKTVPLNIKPKKDNDVEKENERGIGHHHRSHMPCAPDHRRGHADSGLRAPGLDNQGHKLVNPLNGNTKNRMPPYAKLDGATGKNCVEKEENTGLLNAGPQHLADMRNPVQDRQQVPERAAYMRPPYIRPKLNMQTVHDDPAERAASDYNKQDISEQSDHLADKDALQPVSVRTKHAKTPTPVSVYDEAPVKEKVSSRTPSSHSHRRRTSRQDEGDDGCARRDGSRQPHGGNRMDDVNGENVQRTPSSRPRHSGRRNGALYTDDYDGFMQRHQSEEDEAAIDFGNLLPRTGNSHRRHKSRNTDARSGDNEERMMDKLLRHYSKKGLDVQIHTTPTNKTDDVNGAQAQSQPNGAMHPPGRAISLPGESVCHDLDVKVPARSTSLQSDCPRSARVHPKMPDFDELAARVSALRKA